jgi:hypothetical protein
MIMTVPLIMHEGFKSAAIPCLWMTRQVMTVFVVMPPFLVAKKLMSNLCHFNLQAWHTLNQTREPPAQGWPKVSLFSSNEAHSRAGLNLVRMNPFPQTLLSVLILENNVENHLTWFLPSKYCCTHQVLVITIKSKGNNNKTVLKSCDYQNIATTEKIPLRWCVSACRHTATS